MNRDEVVKKAMSKLKNLDKYGPIILKLDKDTLVEYLLSFQESQGLCSEELGDFIQETLITKHRLVQKRPEFKEILLEFVKDQRILGIHF